LGSPQEDVAQTRVSSSKTVKGTETGDTASASVPSPLLSGANPRDGAAAYESGHQEGLNAIMRVDNLPEDVQEMVMTVEGADL